MGVKNLPSFPVGSLPKSFSFDNAHESLRTNESFSETPWVNPPQLLEDALLDIGSTPTP